VRPDDDTLPVLAFADAGEWERWLATTGMASGAGVWLKLAKKGNAASKLTRAQAVDGALIHGWIDGQAAGCDADWSLIRFTPRRARSKWSEKNRSRACELIAAGRMAADGQAEIDRAKVDGRWDAAYAPASTATVPGDLAAALDAVPGARAFFDALDAANRYAILHRLQTGSPRTRPARVARFVGMCENGETLHPARNPRAAGAKLTGG